MKKQLTLVFSLVLVLMVSVTVWSSLEKSVLEGFRDVFASRWATATLADAYCGFLTFYAWVFYKKPGWGSRIFWFLAVMVFGNIAMASFVLRELWRLRPGEGIEKLLLREGSSR
jgi:hypothetical protein